MARCTAVRKCGFALITSALALGAGVTPAYGDYTTPEDKELILTLCKHIAQSRAAIKSFRVEMEYEITRQFNAASLGIQSPVPSGLRTDKRTSTYIASGSLFRSDIRNSITVAGTEYREERRHQIILSENFFATMFSESPNRIQLWEHWSPAEMPQTERKQVEWFAPIHPLRNGFTADENETLEERFARTSTKMKWTVSSSNSAGGTCYLIVQHLFPEQSTSNRRVEYVVSAKCGYMIVLHKSFAENGDLLFESVVTPQVLPNNIWFPKRVIEDDRLNRQRFSLTIVNAEVNTDISDSEFSIDRMEFDKKKTVMFRHPANGGNVEKMVLVENKWVPVEIAAIEKQ